MGSMASAELDEEIRYLLQFLTPEQKEAFLDLVKLMSGVNPYNNEEKGQENEQ